MLIFLIIISYLTVALVTAAFSRRKLLGKTDEGLEYAMGLFWPLVLFGFLVYFVGKNIVRLVTFLSRIGMKKDEIAELNLSKEQKQQVKEIEESDPARILFEINNQELKTKLIKKHGFNNLIEKIPYKVINEDDFGKLIKITYKNMDYYFVKVINGTAEPDGTFKEYYLKVPADMDSAKEAIAWTYKLSPDEYNLGIRT